MAVAALRNLAAKIRIPGPAALRASPAPGPLAISHSTTPKSDLEKALLLRNNIESATYVDLHSSAEVLGKYCEHTEEIIKQYSDVHVEVGNKMRTLTLKYFFTCVAICFTDSMISNKDEVVLQERQGEGVVVQERQVE
ncbi:hypothetical protein CFC21_090177 [Triticum aestivum]|uniref:Uncharacterized protein n=3 Tax=Triticum TaxID=4564 RepID=A0A9R1JSV8_WHEAT|nr:uncharacterized protein LOC119323203 [Triticum dicoccoides]XP_044410109.1 uncharacterized protein LOC123135050 [Triticum aestivum]KAF7028237.1 hypothetical protein CFC21_040195 [Triticum aestivum]KAF7086935.1 hypothetical protein CFC21_090177 [Triticum aestivum]VAI63051.1 unnamed protein product [Triticum turgidum subsp. durum]